MVREVFLEDDEMIIKKSVFRLLRHESLKYNEMINKKSYSYNDLKNLYESGINNMSFDDAYKLHIGDRSED